MTFEQPASLNRFVGEQLPLTWKSRWKLNHVFLPLLVFCTVCWVEKVSFILWQKGELELSRLWPILLMPAFILVVIFICNEIRLRGSIGAKRCLNVLEDGISVYASGRPMVRWSKIAAFWFEDIPGESQFNKVTIEYFVKRKKPRCFSLALEKRTQCPVLLSELRLAQQQHNLTFRIELDQPLSRRPLPRNLMLGMSLYLAGLLFLMHGMPMLLIPLTHDSGESKQSDSNDRWSPKQREKVREFFNAHFSSQAEFKKFMMESGGVLITLGVALMFFGTVVQKPKSEAAFLG